MQKGPEYFVEAAAKVLQKNRNVRFVMAGSGDMMDAMIRLAAKRNIADRFHFTGFLRGRQVYEMLADSDVYVMPSVCAEILDYVIKTDYWDIDAMADAMHALVSYPGLHDMLRDKGIEEIHQITWEKAGKKVIDIYRQVIENRR